MDGVRRGGLLKTGGPCEVFLEGRWVFDSQVLKSIPVWAALPATSGVW